MSELLAQWDDDPEPDKAAIDGRVIMEQVRGQTWLWHSEIVEANLTYTGDLMEVRR